MKVFGLNFSVTKAANNSVKDVQSTWWSSFKGAMGGNWRKNSTTDNRETILSFSPVFACVTGIASDVSKLRFMVLKKNGFITEENLKHPLNILLKKPNRYQGWIKFIEQWVVGGLMHGNTYVLKVRTGQKITELYVLDAQNVTPMISESGEIYYKLKKDNLSNLKAELTVPASEIIHDSTVCLFHPLVGVSPIYASARSATVGNAIIDTSIALFKNGAKPSGILMAPEKISDETAAEIKEYWQKNYSGENSGKIAVLGDNLKYESIAVNAVDADLINQLKWSVEDVARAFRYPLYKLSTGQEPKSNTVESLGLEYYQNCLQPIIERLEECLNNGLEIKDGVEVELDITGLYRMDTDSLYRTNSQGISGGWLSPNEARKKANLPPVKGGDSPFLQQQNYSLADLEMLRAQEQAALNNSPAPAPAPAPMPVDNQQDPQKVFEDLIKTIKKGFANAN